MYKNKWQWYVLTKKQTYLIYFDYYTKLRTHFYNNALFLLLILSIRTIIICICTTHNMNCMYELRDLNSRKLTEFIGTIFNCTTTITLSTYFNAMGNEFDTIELCLFFTYSNTNTYANNTFFDPYTVHEIKSLLLKITI